MNSLRYERPTTDYDLSVFTDLVQYAPGLHNTRADVLATIERESDLTPPSLGKIDAGARRLIEKARSADWSTLSIPAAGALPGYKIHYNGSGQFTYERLLPSGLTEQVICDGKTLWHLYAEIGLAGKRPMSRHHEAIIASFAPAYLPSPEELSRGHNVMAIDANMIALIPLGVDKIKDANYVRQHLVFSKDGALSERQLVAMPKNEVVARQVFLKDGGTVWQDAKGTVLARQTRIVAPASAPSLQPKTEDLVVMEMPIRTRDHLIAQAKKRGLDPEKDPASLEQWFIAECATKELSNNILLHLSNMLRAKNDRRLGFLTLLNSTGVRLNYENLTNAYGKDWSIDIEKHHPKDPLTMLLVQGKRDIANGGNEFLKEIPGPQAGFVQRLSRFRNLWQAWQQQTPIRDAAGLPLERAKVLAFLQDTPSPTFAYAILDTMQRRCNIAPTEPMWAAAAQRFVPISDPLGLGYVFRYEHARSLWQAGNGADAIAAFRKLHADTLSLGVLPPIDAGFRQVLQMPLGAGPHFVGFTRKTLDDVLAKKDYGLAFQLAAQMEQLGDEGLANEIMGTILARADDKERNALTLVNVQILTQRRQFAQADRLLQKLLDDKKLAQAPELWHWRAELAKQHGQTAESIACLEKALDLEYADLPELVDLERVRTDYRTLLNYYQTLAESLTTLKSAAPKALLAKVVRSADRWRLLDVDAAEPSMLAGKIFHTLGQHELAWDYWTTPIDLHPAESKPWLDLAQTLQAEGDLAKADRAFALAFEAEPTNAEILWQRAQNQVRQGQTKEARELYRQIADGKWQERFNATVEQARGLATP